MYHVNIVFSSIAWLMNAVSILSHNFTVKIKKMIFRGRNVSLYEPVQQIIP